MKPVKTLSVLGEQIEIIVTGEMSNGSAAFMVQTTPPGGGPPPHQHSREDETFTVLEGEFKILENGKWRRVPPGEFVFMPRGSVHTFRNVGSTTGKIGVFISPAGFEEFFEQIENIPPENMRKILEIGGRFGLIFHL
ncbi:MAG: cupin domain-containing protein [Edaphobacter sp.]